MRPTTDQRRPNPTAGRVLLLLAAALLLSGVLTACQQPDGSDASPTGSLTAPAGAGEGVPLVRVRLTGRPVSMTRLGSTDGYLLRVDGQTLARSAARLPATSVSRSQGRWTIGALDQAGERLELLPGPEGHVRFGDTRYRGKLVLVAAGPDRFHVDNHLDLESYLAGVLPKELYPNWHVQTYRAQAVAARTFALYQIKTFGRRRDHDLGADTNSQVYGGLSAETPESLSAVAETRGTVLAYGPAGAEKIFLAQYSACNGGVVNGANVIRPARDIPPLAGGQVDPHGRSCPKFNWAPVRIAKADLHRVLAARYSAAARLDRIATVKVAQRTDYGRALWVDVIGANGQRVRVRAEDIRLSLLFGGVSEARKLYSMNCDILDDGGPTLTFANGKGFGHGVGLSQWGAQEKALAGWSAEQILEFYYPESTRIRVY